MYHQKTAYAEGFSLDVRVQPNLHFLLLVCAQQHAPELLLALQEVQVRQFYQKTEKVYCVQGCRRLLDDWFLFTYFVLL